MSDKKNHLLLIKKLQQVLIKQRLIFFTAGILITVVVVVLTSILLSLLASFIILPVTVKIGLLVLSGLVTLFFLSKYALARFFSGDIETMAVRIENRYPELKGRLIAAIEFVRMKKNPGYSADLILQTEEQAIKKAQRINFNESLSFYPLLKNGRLLVGATFLALLLLFFIPGFFSYPLEVYSHPLEVVAPPLGYQVVAQPASSQWIKYRDIKIGASLFGDRLPEKAKIFYRYAGGNWQESDVDLQNEQRHTYALGDSLSFAITLRQVNKSFDYYVKAGRVKTDIQKIDVVDRPRVTGIKLSLFYPDYTKLSPVIIDENNGSFSAVVGTRVNMAVATNLPIEQAMLIFDDSSRTPLKVNGKKAEVALVVNKSQSYYIQLLDRLGEKNPDPIEYYITAVPDEYPSIDVIRPGFDVNLNDEMMLPLKVRIFDDYGFSSLVLKYTVFSQGRSSQENVAVLHFSDRIKTEGEVEFNWDMDKLNLFPGDYVSYYFEIADNDKISGPKITRTRKYIARLPSLDEIVAETENESTQRIENTENLLHTGKDLAERLKNVSRKLKAENRSLKQGDWQKQKELKSIVGKNEEMIKQIEKAAQQMEKSVDQLNQKALLSREVLEKLAQIQKLFEEVATPEMKAAQKRLMEALKKMDPNELQDALKNFQMSQEEMLKRLDRTLALLKKLQLQENMEALIRQIEQLAKKQEEINKTTDSSSKSNLPKLSPQENKNKESLNKLKNKVDDLNKIAEEAKQKNTPEFEKFTEALKKSDADQNMSQMSQALSNKQKTEASQQGKKAHRKLMDMLNTMQQQLMAMKGNQDDAVKKAMRMAMDDANYLSQQQEEILKKDAALSFQSMILRDMAGKQQDLMSACQGLKNRISELGRQSPFVAAELENLVNNATNNMNLAKQNLDAKRGRQAAKNQQDAMVDLNKASIRLMESLNQQSQCNKGGQCNKNTAQLMSLCNRQNNLNQQTQSQCNKPGNNMKPGSGKYDREALQRLAGEQGSIRKSLEQLNQEFGNSHQILGRLDDIAKEMKKVEEALSSGEVGSDVTEQQLKIYSRMLEASRSLYRRDFSQKRQSQSATTNAFYIPKALSSELLNDKINIEDRLHNYLGDSYPPQYEEQIRAYFKALLQESVNLQNQNNQINPGDSLSK